MIMTKKFAYRKNILFLLILFLTACFSFAETHTVEKGETYYSISRKYGISVDQLCAMNNLTVNDVLKVGQKLSIPEKNVEKSSLPSVSTSKSLSNVERKFDTYTVQKGDTFYRIAKVNGISVEELKALNNFDSDTVLKAGQRLKIPVTIVDTSASLPSLPSSDPRKYSEKKGDSSLTWPVKNPTVTYMKGKVSGVQLSAQKNESVTAIRAGTVMYVGNYRGYGQVVFVQAKTGHIYVYSGLDSIKVRKGDYVVFGDSLGTAGTDSIKGTTQICLMVFQKSNPIDPAKAPRG
ncbi:M23 family metallopeptidase [uncultured Treponema sp.]|uniref:M23 family metallopeptidase n=1 Tax=uncultured Treponema sp. TaxID=162155 RepID=UPI0025E394F0|nr:M23 family metallopeptidase [uncultured Treponema sp.]